MELDSLAAVRAGATAGVLWSAATAREIVEDISLDIQLGRMSRTAGLDLIRRVRERAMPEPASPAADDTAGAGPPPQMLR